MKNLTIKDIASNENFYWGNEFKNERNGKLYSKYFLTNLHSSYKDADVKDTDTFEYFC